MKRLFIAFLFVVALVFPFFFQDYWLYVGIISLYYAILASSWSMLAGQAGLISFAHVAFAGIGAYTSAFLVVQARLPIPIAMILGALAAALFGLAIGTLTLRMRGPYLALTTLAFSEILRIFITAEYQLTQGSMGLKVPLIFNGNKIYSYYVGLFLFILTMVVLKLVLQSHVGLFLIAIREDEDGAATRGVNTAAFRLVAFVMTSAFAGLAGGYYAHVVGLVSPQMIRIGEMGLVLAMSVFGGLETLLGSAFGAVMLQALTEYLRIFTEWRMAIFGALVLFTLKFAPEGILPRLFAYADIFINRWGERFRK